MRLTEYTHLLMSFFSKRKCLDKVIPTRKTVDILTHLYHDIVEAAQYVSTIKTMNQLKITKIHSIAQIPKPQMFPDNAFPKEIRDHIEMNTNNHLTYRFSLLGRSITFHFIVEDHLSENSLEAYNNYVTIMLMWLYILNQYVSNSCSKELTIYLYFTSLLKNLPNTNIGIIGRTHVNTAFTTTCPRVSEIVVFRKEEWFKVFMHETFHNFALDFSDMSTSESHQFIRELFPVKSEVNLYEAYAEAWAEIMNACFCSYLEIKDKNNIDDFLAYCDFFINFERTYSFFQMVKTLNFMGLQYTDLYSNTPKSRLLRDNLYKEDSSILSYYVIKLILLNNYQGFLKWCNLNNTSLLQFKKTMQSQRDFCTFIQQNHKTKSMIDGVKCLERFIRKLRNTKQHEHSDYLLKNMRMSICELG